MRFIILVLVLTNSFVPSLEVLSPRDGTTAIEDKLVAELIQPEIEFPKSFKEELEEATRLAEERKREEERLEAERLEAERIAQEKLQARTRVVRFEVSYYCPCYDCNGNTHQITASGARLQAGVTIACPPDIPFGSEVHIDGVGVFINQDTGSYIKYALDKHGNQVMRVDVFVGSHSEAYRRGRHYSDGFIIFPEEA